MSVAATAETIRSYPVDTDYHIEVVSTPDALAALQPEWDRLVDESGVDHPFLYHQWVHTWWECFGTGKQLRVLLVRDESEIRGIAPLMLYTARMYGVSVRCLSSMYNPHTPRFGFIVSGDAEEVYRCLWHYLIKSEGGWDVLELAQLPAGSCTLNYLSRFAGEDGYSTGFWEGERSPSVAFDGSWDSYFSGLHGNHRAKMRRHRRRLARLGTLRLEVVSAGAQLADALDEGTRIEAAAWKEKNGTAIRSDSVVERFYYRFAEKAADAGILRLVFLTLGGERIAFAYALFYRDTFYVLKCGYDPAYARYSPYNVLVFLLLQEGFAKGLREFEFLGRDEPWKLKWARNVRSHIWLFVFARRLRARFLHRVKFRWLPGLAWPRLRGLLRATFPGRKW